MTSHSMTPSGADSEAAETSLRPSVLEASPFVRNWRETGAAEKMGRKNTKGKIRHTKSGDMCTVSWLEVGLYTHAFVKRRTGCPQVWLA